ncbi:MAG: ATP-binding cassette domain-containing protein, partial [Acidobacteria bacterium]
MSTLEYRQMTLRCGATPILDRIELAMAGPGVFALLGPSGVGKSSLLRATQRLIEDGRGGWRRTGDVRLNGDSIFDPGLRQQELARRIGFVQQRPWMLAGSVRHNVELALRHTTRLSRAEIRRRAEAALERVGLAGELTSLERAAWKLSGGQAQRLAIARAIALEPEVLLMDEPISALDPLMAERVEAVIRDLAAEQLIVLVTHKVGLAVRLAAAAGFLLRGEDGARLVETGAAPQIFERPADPVAREFVRMGYGIAAGDAPAPAVAADAAQAMPAPPPPVAAPRP